MNLEVENLNLVKFFLTHMVLYSVSTYTAVALKLEFQIGTNVVAVVDLKCHGCKQTVHIKENEIIPECES